MNVHEDIGPTMMGRGELYALFRDMAVIGQQGMELTLQGKGMDLPRARAKMAEIRAKLGPADNGLLG